MKKIFPKIIALLLTLSCVLISASAIDLVVDNNKLELDVEPVVIEQRTLVPLRAIFEELGANVDWDQATMTATATKGSDIVQITIDSTTAYVNEEAKTLDVAATAINGRTMVPVRFVSEALNAKVYWLPDAQTVRIATQLYDVVSVVDGDTIVVNCNGVEEKVRLIGVDTPESVHPDSSKNTEAGILASDYTKKHLEGKQVELEFDVQQRDQYGRLLAYVYLDGVMYNKTLLEDGIANIATYPPNVKYVDDFTAIVAERNPQPEPEEPANSTEPTAPSTTTKPNTTVPSDSKGEPEDTQRPVGGMVWVSRTGSKYHNKSSCGNMKNPSYITLSEAQSRGLTPCSKCY